MIVARRFQRRVRPLEMESRPVGTPETYPQLLRSA